MTQRVLLYIRQSDSHGAGRDSLSLDSQERELRARAAAEGWAVVGVEADADLRGWQDETERPGLARAVARAEAGEFDTLLVWDLSRFARDVRIQETIVWRLARVRVGIVSHTEPHAADDLIRVIFGALHQRRSQEIGQNVRRAMKERARRGLPHGGPTPYAYRRAGKDAPLVPGPATEIATIRLVYALAADGRSKTEIARELTERGIPAPAGGPWYLSTVAYLLGNPIYRGAQWSRHGTAEGAVPPLVDEATWHAAQAAARLRPNRGRGRRTKDAESWLEGLATHECGLPLYLHAPRGRQERTFRCRDAYGNRRGPGWPACPVAPAAIAAHRFEVEAWAILERDLSAVVSPDAVLADLRRRYEAAAPGAAKLRRKLQSDLARLNAARDRALDLYVSGRDSQAGMDRRLAAIAAERAQAEAALAALPEAPDEAALEAAWTVLAEMRSVVALVTEPADRRRLLHRLGEAVLLGGGRPVGRGLSGVVAVRYLPEWRLFLGGLGMPGA